MTQICRIGMLTAIGKIKRNMTLRKKLVFQRLKQLEHLVLSIAVTARFGVQRLQTFRAGCPVAIFAVMWQEQLSIFSIAVITSLMFS